MTTEIQAKILECKRISPDFSVRDIAIRGGMRLVSAKCSKPNGEVVEFAVECTEMQVALVQERVVDTCLRDMRLWGA